MCGNSITKHFVNPNHLYEFMYRTNRFSVNVRVHALQPFISSERCSFCLCVWVCSAAQHNKAYMRCWLWRRNCETDKCANNWNVKPLRKRMFSDVLFGCSVCVCVCVNGAGAAPYEPNAYANIRRDCERIKWRWIDKRIYADGNIHTYISLIHIWKFQSLAKYLKKITNKNTKYFNKSISNKHSFKYFNFYKM